MFSQHAYFLQDNKLKPDIKKMAINLTVLCRIFFTTNSDLL
jgi:hypothetical protein